MGLPEDFRSWLDEKHGKRRHSIVSRIHRMTPEKREKYISRALKVSRRGDSDIASRIEQRRQERLLRKEEKLLFREKLRELPPEQRHEYLREYRQKRLETRKARREGTIASEDEKYQIDTLAGEDPINLRDRAHVQTQTQENNQRSKYNLKLIQNRWEQHLRNLVDGWDTIPEDKQLAILQRLLRIQSFGEERRLRIKNNFDQWKQLDESKRQQLRQQLTQLRQRQRDQQLTYLQERIPNESEKSYTQILDALATP